MFEIVLYKGQSYVELFYKTSKDQNDLKPISIPNCGHSCPLERMYQLYEDVLPTKTFEEECSSTDACYTEKCNDNFTERNGRRAD